MARTPERTPENEDLSKAFRAHVLREQFFPKHSTVLVGVSGRSDSVALLRLLANLALELRIRLVVGNVHGETPEAKADATFVHHLATTLTMPFTATPADPAPEREDTNHDPRFTPLSKLAEEAGAAIVATAETQDDAAEQLLATLLGDDPLFGGLLQSSNGMRVRPLLPFSHEACVTYLTRRGFLFRLNPDALALDTPAAKMRLLVLPMIQRHLSADALGNLATASEMLAGDDSFLEELARAAREEVHWAHSDESVTVHHASWKRLPTSLRYRLLLDAVRLLTPTVAVSRASLQQLDSRCRLLTDGSWFDLEVLKISSADGILTLHLHPSSSA